VIFYVSNNHERSLEPTGVLHTRTTCATLGKADRRAWEATPSEIATAYTLCKQCAPLDTGNERPEV
jgi:hypothetical protein